MGKITTEAWVLYQGPGNAPASKPEPGALRKELFSFPDIEDDEVLAEPLFGCWEANMTHALERRPVDICKLRGEEKIVIGNAGVVRILKTGSSVTTTKEGDKCLIFGNTTLDEHGFANKVFGYDAPGTIGLLAKRMKVHQTQVIPIPDNTSYLLEQWATLSVRYITAWGNWHAAYRCFRALLSEEEYPSPYVWGWGGGTALAELSLAKLHGCKVAMIASSDERLALIERMGITPINRRQFLKLSFDEKQYQTNVEFKKAYRETEQNFLEVVKKHTMGRGVSIFIDYIGYPVARATVKALARPGVITTAGWKGGMKIPILRALECINWHVHVHTHYARQRDAIESVHFAEKHGWLPSLDDEVYSWDNIPQLAIDYSRGAISSYFPIFQVNPL